MACSILTAHLLTELAEAGNVGLRDAIPTLIVSAQALFGIEVAGVVRGPTSE